MGDPWTGTMWGEKIGYGGWGRGVVGGRMGTAVIEQLKTIGTKSMPYTWQSSVHSSASPIDGGTGGKAGNGI